MSPSMARPIPEQVPASTPRQSPSNLDGLSDNALPRILCLHGGGTNARIFRAQCRVLRTHLATWFRLVFAEAPCPSPPGPDVESVYGEWGPFRAWLPAPTSNTPDVGSIDACVAAAMDGDDGAGGSGPLIGLLGFSQGARVAASLLLRQQRLNLSRREAGMPSSGYRFAILLAGRPPLLPMDSANDDIVPSSGPEMLELPTIHVHGLRDPDIDTHRDLLSQCCREFSTRTVEWDGDHRVPITTKDVAAVVAQIQDVALRCGIQW